ncbi:MAG: hypothetical protein ABJC12_13780, partial [Saprospiraceae bacterium]
FFIFDRWGNVLYAADHFQPNDPMYAWDGKMKGRVLNPGVFVYRLLLRFKDGRIELRNGDITIVR